jgi:hypothetical protein
MNKSIFQQTRIVQTPAILPANVEKALQVFMDYLDDKLPPLLASDSLSMVLRTEAPVQFGLARIVDTVRSWAGRRSKDSGRPVVEFLSNALWRIGHASAAGVLEGFVADDFFPEFIHKLQALCPPDQQPAFKAKLTEIREYFEWDFGERAEQSYDAEMAMEGMSIAGTPESEFNESAEQLVEQSNDTGGATFNRGITQLREQLYHPDFKAAQCIARLIEVGISLFNSGKNDHAEQVFNLIREGLKLPQLGDDGRARLRSSHNSGELNQELLLKLLGDSTKHQSVKALLPVFADLEPKNLLKRLRFEKDKEYRRLLLTIIKLHGPDVFPVIIEDLQASQKEARSWYYLRNLIFLLGKIPPPSDFHRYVAVNLIGEFLSSKFQQLRTAALSTLNVLGGESGVDYVLDALNEQNYTAVDTKGEHLHKYFNNLIAFLARYPNEQTLTALAGVVTGSKLGFVPNSDPLRQTAYALLKHHAAKLPDVTARFMTNHLENELKSRGLGFGGFAVGIDTDSCLRILDLLSYTRNSETRRLLCEIKSKYARHALGRRAAEILSAQS